MVMKHRRNLQIQWAIAISIIAIAFLFSNPSSSSSSNINNGYRSFVVDGFVVQQRPPVAPSRATNLSLPSPTSTVLGATPVTGPPAPVLNGKRILPIKIMLAGLKGHTVAASYAILSPAFKTSTDGDWSACQHVGITKDLGKTLADHSETHGRDKVAHVRALSFLIPSEAAMESIAMDWRRSAIESGGGRTNFDPILAAMDVEDVMDDDDDGDFDDDDDDDDDDEYFEMMAGAMAARSQRQDEESVTAVARAPSTTQGGDDDDDDSTVVSPFDDPQSYATTTEDGSALEFNKETVDKVLDEIRPYLISDGGNVSIDSVDVKTKSVYLVLEGACGSCPSSTVTMQMGIERVLKENFADLGEVKQVDPDADDSPKELTYLTVEKEVNRIKPAIIAMGGLVTIVEVDPIGTVKLRFRGANKVRQGLEMALLDIDFVKHVDFVME